MIDQDLNLTESTEPTIASNPLPTDRLEKVTAWGNASHSHAYVYRPSTVSDLQAIFQQARETGRTVGFRAGGNSYGDAPMNREELLVNLSRLDRILDWNPQTGRIKVEPGVTLRRLWQYALADGWWPAICTGTMNTTMGGCAAVNAHGKNAWQVGHFGDHVFAFELLLPSGEILTCSREENSDLFFAAIGGLGLLGCFVSLTIQLKRVYSGLLKAEAATRPNLKETMEYFDEYTAQSDYIVGWIDAFAKGNQLGRSELHRATMLPAGADPNPAQTLQVAAQKIPEEVLGLIPASVIWRFQRPFWNNLGLPWVNFAKYHAARLKGTHSYRQPHAVFHFLLDHFDWAKPFGAGGLIQYQSFLPKETALETYTQMLRLCQQRGMPNFLSVLKRHRPDDFLLSYAVDGYSMAMDFRITKRNKQRMVELMREMDALVLGGNGRFYFAKDSTLRPEVAHAYLGDERLNQFFALKQRVDPTDMLQSDLWRRVLRPLR